MIENQYSTDSSMYSVSLGGTVPGRDEGKNLQLLDTEVDACLRMMTLFSNGRSFYLLHRFEFVASELCDKKCDLDDQYLPLERGFNESIITHPHARWSPGTIISDGSLRKIFRKGKTTVLENLKLYIAWNEYKRRV